MEKNKYNDIGDLYRDMFSGYEPEPPSFLWDNILRKMTTRKPSLWKKAGIPVAGAFVVGVGIYLLVANLHTEETPLKTENIQTVTSPVEPSIETVTDKTSTVLVENDVAPLTKTPTVQNIHALSPATDALADSPPSEHLSADNNNVLSDKQENDHSKEPNRHTVNNVFVPDTLISSPKNNEIREQEEVHPVKILPLKISKDTLICRNTAAKLYVGNASNIRWSTGETGNSITVFPSYDQQYALSFTTGDGKDTTVYIHVKVVECTEVFIPNVFSPNGDGLNDVFIVTSNMELAFFEMTVYTANGNQILFTSKNSRYGWDGTYQQQIQPHGLYYYTVRYTDNFGKLIEKSGEVLLKLY
ncbi:MAG: gliding motility-associated C-terminal domain-containing protein [Bacteroidales bacterium]|jgi:gliding motility-associated-like protein|nr:gliding motility-associated C-terminal domain-containing protein [Bacteroidales bacterium]